MCLLLLALDAHPVYKLVIAANRDEFYERPTADAGFWNERPDILAGRDMRSKGTWFGITRKGRIAAVTNYRDPAAAMPDAPSRGHLVSEFLAGQEDPGTYLTRLQPRAAAYNGFNLVAGIKEQLFWYSNRGSGIHRIPPGIHGLSNHLLNTPWPKVSRGKTALHQLLADASEPPAERFLDILLDRSIPKDETLPNTGVGMEWERILSPVFIASPDYGTRSSTLLLMDRKGHVTFVERTHDRRPGREVYDAVFEFKIEG